MYTGQVGIGLIAMVTGPPLLPPRQRADAGLFSLFFSLSELVLRDVE